MTTRDSYLAIVDAVDDEDRRSLERVAALISRHALVASSSAGPGS